MFIILQVVYTTLFSFHFLKVACYVLQFFIVFLFHYLKYYSRYSDDVKLFKKTILEADFLPTHRGNKERRNNNLSLRMLTTNSKQ